MFGEQNRKAANAEASGINKSVYGNMLLNRNGEDGAWQKLL